MMNLPFSNKDYRGRRRRRWWWLSCTVGAIGLWVLSSLGACSDSTTPGDGQPPGSCTDEESPSIPHHAEEAFLRGRVTLEMKVSYDEAGLKTLEGSARASFTDISAVEVHSRPPSWVSTPGCYGLTGSVTTTCREGHEEPCRTEYVALDSVSMDGLAGGATTLAEDSTGIFSKDGLEVPPFVAQQEMHLQVKGQTAAGSFPSYEQSLVAPDPLELSAPALPAEPLGSKDLTVQWAKGNGDYVVISISHLDSTVTDKIQCIVYDDGCHTIQVGDLEFYDIIEGTKFKVSIAREKIAVKALDDHTSAELKASSKVELSLVK